ncbi:hypothetical protein KBX50_06120 [Micromonospora sp. C51]|uniref:hypothetical protein n=1 Tax=Micromonospora sp. C51 TaxID=2824879 RepID=UPI001B39C6A9|nr:hypothetical protein [Micromonospora sp. C51]MBQ1048037.1 hypothetical protein [Micromonospora sp. C51]
MIAAAPARPLWWLARWAARLLTGLAVAAAFTLGAWALPGHPAPTDWPATPAPLAETAVAPASTGPAVPLGLAAPLDPAATLDLVAALDLAAPLDLAASLDLVGLATPAARWVGDAAGPAGACASPTRWGADDPADPAGASATQPPTCGRPGLTVLGSVAASVTRLPVAPVGGVRAARAPPHA